MAGGELNSDDNVEESSGSCDEVKLPLLHPLGNEIFQEYKSECLQLSLWKFFATSEKMKKETLLSQSTMWGMASHGPAGRALSCLLNHIASQCRGISRGVFYFDFVFFVGY